LFYFTFDFVFYKTMTHKKCSFEKKIHELFSTF
jgi:hypothetical protein